MAGVPFGTPGSTNVLHVVRLIGDELDAYATTADLVDSNPTIATPN